jgi:hypothetical protein
MNQLGELIVERIERQASPDGSFGGNALETAFATNVLSHWSPASPIHLDALRFLIDVQREDGSWPARVICHADWVRGLAWGCAELTTGLCLEALGRFLARNGGPE